MKKNKAYHMILGFVMILAVIGIEDFAKSAEDTAASGQSETPKGEAASKDDWIITKRKEGMDFDFSDYAKDAEMSLYFNDAKFRLDEPVFKKGGEVWLPMHMVVPKLDALFLREDEYRFMIVRSDGTPLEFTINDNEVEMNKMPFLTLDQPPRTFAGSFFLTAASLAKALDLSYSYDQPVNAVRFNKEKTEDFSAFTLPKPKPPPEEKREAAPEVKPLPPPDVREEMLPEKYRRDIDLKADTTVSYLYDRNTHDRTRQLDWYVSGRAFDYRVDGRYRMRDFRTSDKQRLKEDGEFIGLYSDKVWFKFLDNYLTLPQLRSQSQSYFGMEVTDFYDPFKSTIIVGETDNTVAGSGSVGSVRYLGNLYVIKQDYKDINDLFDISGMAIVHETGAVNQSQSSTTTYPRRNLVWLIDTTTYLYKNVNLYYTYAMSNYVPDNKVNARLIDDNWKVGLSMEEDRFNFKTFYEHVGNQYASIGIPSTYQDFESWDFSANFKFSPTWYGSLGGRMNNNNVERNPRVPKIFDNTLYLNSGFYLPWQQNLNLSYNVTESTTKGGDADLSGNRYKDYRLDYSKNWLNTNFQLTLDHYLLEMFGTATGGTITDSGSISVAQFIPELNNSYIRFYQDMRKTKTLSDASYTTTNWNTDFSARWILTDYLNALGGIRVATTQREAMKDTALASLSLSAEFKSSPITIWTVDYSLTNYDLYNPDNQTTKYWTILFRVRHVFDVTTPEKWGSVKVLVYRDLNSNGRYDNGEPGIPDIKVNIVDGRAATTGKDGWAVIKKVVPGNRKVKINLATLPLEMAVRGAPPVQFVTIEPFKTPKVEFPIVATGKIKGRVYVDINKNGIYEREIDEMMPNVRIYVEPSGQDTLTFSDGSYFFDYIYPGEHEVAIDTETIPEDYKLSSPQKIKVSLKEKDVMTDMDFLLSSRPIVMETFDKE